MPVKCHRATKCKNTTAPHGPTNPVDDEMGTIITCS